MFERFTEKAIKVIMLAQEEARRLGHNFVGTEQILLGLIGEGLIFIGRAVPGLVPALTFVARFFTGWVAFFIAAFDIAIPGSISRFITILVEEFKIGFAHVKALFRGLGIVFTETMNLLKKAWKGFIDIKFQPASSSRTSSCSIALSKIL